MLHYLHLRRLQTRLQHSEDFLQRRPLDLQGLDDRLHTRFLLQISPGQHFLFPVAPRLHPR